MGKTVRYFNQKDDQKGVKKKGINKKKNLEDKLDTSQQEGNQKIITFNVANKKPLRDKQKQKPKLVKKKFKPDPKPRFPGKAPVDKKILEKHQRGEGVNVKSIKGNINKIKLKQKEKAIEFSLEQAARTEILLTEDTGLLEADSGETTTQFRQSEIAKNVDITAATKHFELHLREFGPYRMNYTRNGRHLLLGGRKGHVAAMDWVTKKLHCEFNVMESIHDICWLHLETMLAVAQQKWVYIYDNQGIELHCLKKLNKVSRMQFLPYHFLLATASEEGYLSWLDISIGQMVVQFNSKLGRLNMMCQNPQNATLAVGGSKGVVSLWSPNVRDPLVKLLCHKTAMTSLHIDPKGCYLATAATDSSLKIWDIRNLVGPLQDYRLRSSAQEVNFSQKGLLSVGMGNVVEVYKDSYLKGTKNAYLRHVMNSTVGNMQFCPHEDVLGVATSNGYTSLIVPGAGEANYDAFEINPYQTKEQRREAEVKALLEKIPADMITLDQSVVADVHLPTMKEKIEEKKRLLYVKVPKIDATPRKKKGSGTVQLAKTKKIIQETAKREFIRDMTAEQKKTQKNKNKTKNDNALDRFL